MSQTAEVVICGAGIAGISLAHQLARVNGMRRVVLIDERPPLTLTSDKSSEAYRNWWPGPDDAMIRLMNRSIDLLEDLATASGNRFLMNRRGYLWCTADPIRADDYREHGLKAAAEGAGELRIHTGRMSDPDYRPHTADGWQDQPEGADLILEDMLLQQAFPVSRPRGLRRPPHPPLRLAVGAAARDGAARTGACGGRRARRGAGRGGGDHRRQGDRGADQRQERQPHHRHRPIRRRRRAHARRGRAAARHRAPGLLGAPPQDELRGPPGGGSPRSPVFDLGRSPAPRLDIRGA